MPAVDWLPPLAVVSMSGGKDSTATALRAVEDRGLESCRFLFADTGNEHEETLRYVTEYLPTVFGKIEIVKADFADKMARKREYVDTKWREEGVDEKLIESALRVLAEPTGNPFLDLCLWKGRFPSRRAQFCTQFLKRIPLENYFFDLMTNYKHLAIESWRGIRRDESQNRKDAKDREQTPEGFWIVHPIAAWTAQQTVDYVVSKGVKLNVLYERGMGRVGCMPCINVRKDELLEISKRFPEHIDRIREWESLVAQASKIGAASFFYDGENAGEGGIDGKVRWAQTKYGGKEIDPERLEDAPMCSSMYGLCE